MRTLGRIYPKSTLAAGYLKLNVHFVVGARSLTQKQIAGGIKIAMGSTSALEIFLIEDVII